jgi:hypothetical protein
MQLSKKRTRRRIEFLTFPKIGTYHRGREGRRKVGRRFGG